MRSRWSRQASGKNVRGILNGIDADHLRLQERHGFLAGNDVFYGGRAATSLVSVLDKREGALGKQESALLLKAGLVFKLAKASDLVANALVVSD